MARSLKDIELDEVSVVDMAANKKKFLFFKRGKSDDDGRADSIVKQGNLKVLIESDGTEAGTKILVNGKEVDGLDNFYFSYYKPWDMKLDGKEPASISCSYSKVVEAEDTGFKRTETFHLAKGDKQMDKELLDLIKGILGDDFKEEEFQKQEKLSDEIIAAIKGALKLVGKYQADLPADLKNAVAVLVRYAGYGYGYGYGKKEGGTEDGEGSNIDKSGKKLSKDTLEKLMEAIKALQSLIPEGTKIDKAASDDVLKVIKESIDKVSELVQGDGKKLEGLTSSVSDVTKRLEAVEKEKGVKKNIEGQDDNGGDNQNLQKGAGKDGQVLWPSLVKRVQD